MDSLKNFVPLLSPIQAFLIALWGIGGALIIKRFFTLQDRRFKKDERCDRVFIAYRILMAFSQSNFSNVVAIIHMRDNNLCDDQYVVRRIREIAKMVPPYERLDNYIETGEEITEEESDGKQT